MAALKFQVRAGLAEENSVRIMTHSLVYSGDVLLDIPGVAGSPFTIPMSAVCSDGFGDQFGADRDSADTLPAGGYVGALDVGGLTGNTAYPWTATQVGHADTLDGQFRSASGVDDDFSRFLIGCDNFNTVTQYNDVHKVGAWGKIATYLQSDPVIPVAGIDHVEDNCYADQGDTDDKNGTGYFTTYKPNAGYPGVGQNYSAYSYALAYARYHGFMTDANANGTDQQIRNDRGHGVERQYCFQNANHSYGVGDHEETNDPEEEVRIQERRDVARTAFETILGRIIEPGYVDMPNSFAWAWRNGCAQYLMLDRMSQCSDENNPTWDLNTYEATGAPYVSIQQIDALIGAYDPTAHFTVLEFTMGSHWLMSIDDIKSLNAGTFDGEASPPTYPSMDSASAGVQQPLNGYNSSEYEKLMTDPGTSLLAQARSNDIPFIGLHGDIHRYEEIVIDHANEAPNIQESYHILSCGSVNGFANQMLIPDVVPNYVFDRSKAYKGSGITYEMPEASIYPQTTQGGTASCARVDVFGSESPKRIVVSLYGPNDQIGEPGDLADQPAHVATFYENEGNLSDEYLTALRGEDMEFSTAPNVARVLESTDLLGLSKDEGASYSDANASLQQVKEYAGQPGIRSITVGTNGDFATLKEAWDDDKTKQQFDEVIKLGSTVDNIVNGSRIVDISGLTHVEAAAVTYVKLDGYFIPIERNIGTSQLILQYPFDGTSIVAPEDLIQGSPLLTYVTILDQLIHTATYDDDDAGTPVKVMAWLISAPGVLFDGAPNFLIDSGEISFQPIRLGPLASISINDIAFPKLMASISIDHLSCAKSSIDKQLRVLAGGVALTNSITSTSVPASGSIGGKAAGAVNLDAHKLHLSNVITQVIGSVGAFAGQLCPMTLGIESEERLFMENVTLSVFAPDTNGSTVQNRHYGLLLRTPDGEVVLGNGADFKGVFSDVRILLTGGDEVYTNPIYFEGIVYMELEGEMDFTNVNITFSGNEANLGQACRSLQRTSPYAGFIDAAKINMSIANCEFTDGPLQGGSDSGGDPLTTIKRLTNPDSQRTVTTATPNSANANIGHGRLTRLMEDGEVFDPTAPGFGFDDNIQLKYILTKLAAAGSAAFSDPVYQMMPPATDGTGFDNGATAAANEMSMIEFYSSGGVLYQIRPNVWV